MTKEKWGEYAKALKSVYTDPKFLPDGPAMEVWYRLLADLSDKQVYYAITAYMQSNHFAPTPADIRAMVQRNEEPEELMISAEEAWSQVRRAACNSNYNAEREFNRLSPLVQKAIGNPANLKEMAVMPSDTFETVEKSHFIRDYNTQVARHREDQKLSIGLKKAIGIALQESGALQIEEVG